MVPHAVTQAVMAAEDPAVTAWADRHRWAVTVESEDLTLRAETTHPVLNRTVIFHADLSGYPAIPPAWTCMGETGSSTSAAYPTAGSRPGLPSSIYHPNPVICAPWNRLAYAIHGGPHNDWGDLVGWKTAGAGSTQAHTVADMLDALRLHLSCSPGMHA